ncbi:hypothetical protein [Candidatus Finniella inopinata]|uniref:Uncharacterized protein n=1 Tax=Candidatus Finniella inopinata TaxID=1696036 RepID=A0A4Q7DGQ2_9PROT|nr:hypothetical protein [Candidatus Finniella inopinata]RZI45259.1 hypothetical protein EQU50_07655 [Candidatus Finniella inopinata]
MRKFESLCLFTRGSPLKLLGVQASASATALLYETADKALILTNFISGDKDPRPIDILNRSGSYFEK